MQHTRRHFLFYVIQVSGDHGQASERGKTRLLSLSFRLPLIVGEMRNREQHLFHRLRTK